VKVLRDIAVPANIGDVIAELREQATSSDAPLSKLALSSLGDIAMRMPAVAVTILETILELLTLPVDYIVNSCILVLRDLLRVYPLLRSSLSFLFSYSSSLIRHPLLFIVLLFIILSYSSSSLIHRPLLFIVLSYSSSSLIHHPLLFIILSYSSSSLIHHAYSSSSLIHHPLLFIS
jgi:vesicle coat complex subunit